MDCTLSACANFEIIKPRPNIWDPNYILFVDFWTTIFYNLKNSGSDESNEGSSFILSSLEVGH